MTKQETRAAIKALPGMTADCIDGEWRVTINFYALAERYPGKKLAFLERRQEALASYTDDADDAIGTARDMSKRWQAQA